VLEQVHDLDILPKKYSKENYAQLSPILTEYFDLSLPFQLNSAQTVVSNWQGLQRLINKTKHKLTPKVDEVLSSYYKDYWIYYQYWDRKQGWLTDEADLTFVSTSAKLNFAGSTESYILEHAFRSRNMITLFLRKRFGEFEYESLTIEFAITDTFHNRMECFTGTATGLREIISTHITASILMVLKSVKNFKRLDDERIHKFFEQQTIKCLEPKILQYFSLDAI
jgi:hypothetical protein